MYIPHDTSENRFILDDIQDYLEYLGNEDSNPEVLTKTEEIKVMANLAYFAEQYKYNTAYNDHSKMMGRLRYFISILDGENT